MIAVCSGVVFWGAGDLTLNPLCQHPTCRIGRKICTAIPCIFISVHCRGSGSCMCQLLGSISAPKRNHFHIEEARQQERLRGSWLCDFLVSQLDLLLWCADIAAVSQGSWTQELREKWKVHACTYFLVGILCNEPVKKLVSVVLCLFGVVLFCCGVFGGCCFL